MIIIDLPVVNADIKDLSQIEQEWKVMLAKYFPRIP